VRKKRYVIGVRDLLKLVAVILPLGIYLHQHLIDRGVPPTIPLYDRRLTANLLNLDILSVTTAAFVSQACARSSGPAYPPGAPSARRAGTANLILFCLEQCTFASPLNARSPMLDHHLPHMSFQLRLIDLQRSEAPSVYRSG